MESMSHTDNSFVTLTYQDDKLPRTGASDRPTLYPAHLRDFLKRLRHHSPQKIRYFAVGEYGDTSFRPHYHFAGFNFPNCQRGETKKSLGSARCLWRECCSHCEMVGNIWGHGDIELRTLDSSKCEYLARYVVKKMTGGDDARLLDRHPEFSRQSKQQGGIGFPGVAQLAKTIRQHVDPQTLIDVPLTIKQGKTNHLPLGRYIRNKLRLQLGLPEGAPDAALRQAWIEQVLPMHEVAQKNQTSLKAAFALVNAEYEARLRAQMELKGRGKI